MPMTSLTRAPVEYKISKIALSRSEIESPSRLADSMSEVISLIDNALGKRLGVLSVVDSFMGFEISYSRAQYR